MLSLRATGRDVSSRPKAKHSPHRRRDCLVAAMVSIRAKSIALLNHRVLLLATTWLLVACMPVASPLPTATPPPSETPAPTETIVWFPATATPTLLSVPTYTGTPEMSPGIGKVTLRDGFSDASVWDTATSDQGSASITGNHLTLAVQPGYYLSSMRHKTTVTDFYAEITARPSLCRGEDNYGLIIRGVGSSFYRFVLACNGQIRMERISGGTKLLIQEPVPSGDAPGAPGEVRIGVWAVGRDLRLFLNGRYQFGVMEPTFNTGGIGVYVRAAGDTPVTITFSDLRIYDVHYTPPTRTPVP